MEACILFGVGLAAYALIVYLTTKAKETPQNGVRTGVQSSRVSSGKTTLQKHRHAPPPPLPPRRTGGTAVRPRTNIPGSGPRGLRPSQFPCCPMCHQRNDGAEQKIFWYGNENLYRCTRGHKFHANGRPYFS